MAKHLFHNDYAFARVYHEDPVTVIVTFLRGEDGFIVENTAPARPTGAHRHETVPVDTATYVYATFVECVRNPTPGMMEFEFIDIPRV